MELESTLTGVAGEYFVAAELTLRKYVAAITLRNSRGIDIIASSADGSRSLSIQVKSSSGGAPSWLLGASAERFFSASHYYFFVVLKTLGDRPDFHIVPSKVVADSVSESHRTWLSQPKRDGSARKDSSMRKFSDHDGTYLERWELLDKRASDKDGNC